MTRFRAGTLFLLYAILWLAGCGGTPQDAATGEPYTSPSGTFTLTLPAGGGGDVRIGGGGAITALFFSAGVARPNLTLNLDSILRHFTRTV